MGTRHATEAGCILGKMDLPEESADVFGKTSFAENVLGRNVVGRNPTDRGRRATKVSLLVDPEGMPLCTVFRRGNKSDISTFWATPLEADDNKRTRG